VNTPYLVPEDFGAIGDGLSHHLSGVYATLADAQVVYPFATSLSQEIDYCALQKAITSDDVGTGPGIMGPKIVLPHGAHYRCGTDTIQIKRQINIAGHGGLLNGNMPTIEFAADTTGFIIHRWDTIGSGAQTPPTTGGDGSVLEGFRVAGNRGTNTSAHGVWLRARAILNRVFVDHFAGNGINIVASASGVNLGNANNFEIHSGRTENNGGHGLFVDGDNCNAGKVIGLDASNNDRCGIFESGFLGNAYFGCHTSSNGRKSFVHHDGNRYYCLSDTLGGSVTPGTDSSVWEFLGPGGPNVFFATWVSGGVYYVGAGYRTDGATAQHAFYGCYSEPNEPPSHMRSPTMWIGGQQGAGFTKASTVFRIEGDTGGGLMTAFSMRPRADSTISNVFLPASDESFRMLVRGDQQNGTGMVWDAATGTWVVQHARISTRTAYRLTTDLTTITGGRSTPIGGGSMLLDRGYWMGTHHSVIRHYTNGLSAPTSGEWAQGDTVENIEPSPNGWKGWVCVESGTPGVWKGYGKIEA
jgi:hypothetical protein